MPRNRLSIRSKPVAPELSKNTFHYTPLFWQLQWAKGVTVIRGGLIRNKPVIAEQGIIDEIDGAAVVNVRAATVLVGFIAASIQPVVH